MRTDLKPSSSVDKEATREESNQQQERERKRRMLDRRKERRRGRKKKERMGIGLPSVVSQGTVSWITSLSTPVSTSLSWYM